MWVARLSRKPVQPTGAQHVFKTQSQDWTRTHVLCSCQIVPTSAQESRVPLTIGHRRPVQLSPHWLRSCGDPRSSTLIGWDAHMPVPTDIHCGSSIMLKSKTHKPNNKVEIQSLHHWASQVVNTIELSSVKYMWKHVSQCWSTKGKWIISKHIGGRPREHVRLLVS